jgi:hypothetical protein
LVMRIDSIKSYLMRYFIMLSPKTARSGLSFQPDHFEALPPHPGIATMHMQHMGVKIKV